MKVPVLPDWRRYPRSLGIDVGYANCGYALAEIGASRRLISHGHWKTNPSDGSPSDRVRAMASKFGSYVTEHRPNCVGVEAFNFQTRTKNGGHNAAVARYMNELIGRMKQICEGLGIPVFEIPTTTTKSALGLTGKVSKESVRQAVERLFGERINEHAADAVAVAVAAERKWRREQFMSSATRPSAVVMEAATGAALAGSAEDETGFAAARTGPLKSEEHAACRPTCPSESRTRTLRPRNNSMRGPSGR